MINSTRPCPATCSILKPYDFGKVIGNYLARCCDGYTVSYQQSPITGNDEVFSGLSAFLRENHRTVIHAESLQIANIVIVNIGDHQRAITALG